MRKMEMQKHSEAKNWLQLRMALSPLVPSPHSLKLGWILHISDQEICVSTKLVLPQHGLYPESPKGQD